MRKSCVAMIEEIKLQIFWVLPPTHIVEFGGVDVFPMRYAIFRHGSIVSLFYELVLSYPFKNHYSASHRCIH